MKKILIKTLIIFYIFLPIINVQALDINSEYAVLYNLNDDKIIYEKNSNEKIKIASLTKIMTTLVALENIEDIKQTTTIKEEALIGLEDYAKTDIKPNEEITYEDLLYGIMLPSGADCANGIAINISGSIDNFVELMNKKAKELNLNNTHFSNPIGADEDNYSTVEDVAKLLKYALKNEEFYKIFTTREYTTTNNVKLESTIIEKSSPYNIDTSLILGSKTGFTDDAGNCLASISKQNGINYLLVTAKAPITNSYHIIDAQNLYEYYKDNYSYKKILEYNKPIKTIKVKEGIKQTYEIKSDKDIYLFLNNEIDINNLTYEYEGLDEIDKNTEKIGTLKIKNNDDIIYTYDILSSDNITFYNEKIYITSLALIVLTTLLLIIRIINKNSLHKNS